MSARDTFKSALDAVGMLDRVRRLLRRVRAVRRQRYYGRVLGQYRHPLAKLTESFAAYERREREASERAARLRARSDHAAILEFAHQRFAGRQPGREVGAALAVLAGEGVASAGAGASDRADRAALVRAIVDRVVDPRFAPRFHDYDYIDDIVGIVGGRYCSDGGCDRAASARLLDALSILAGSERGDEWQSLPQALRQLLGPDHGYVPSRGEVTQHMWNVIPDLAREFIGLKAETNVDRFLEINREYSRRQAADLGLWDVRDLSLLRGYERDHHLLLRTLVELLDGGELSADDEVLLIGPRHIDEIVFFRKSLGLRKTIGLDLFGVGDSIVAGDMHRMPFESGRFKLVYSCNTLSYAYNARRVVDEIARVSRRPAYVFIIDSGNRKAGPDALGRSDLSNIDALIGLFHRHAFRVLAKDAGRSLAPEMYENQPCLALRLESRINGAGGGQ